MTVITRFPPSPTGFMHIGNARTALYNWLYARHHKGEFVLRIEDTDRERSTDEAVHVIFQSLEWLGLEYDNDEVVYQSQRTDRYIDVANQLLKEGKAYHCYCTPEELEEMRESAKTEGRAVAYDRRWRDKSPDDAPKGINPVIRIKAPLEGVIAIDDHLQGHVVVNSTQIDDFILVRSDGAPTYMLSVVVDDHDMNITHVIRGNDHLNNAFRQSVIFTSMGWTMPQQAHLPLITGPDGAKYSKRHGAVGVLDFRDKGFLPEALRNYLLRLGWGHGDNEIISTDQAIEWFDLPGCNNSAARFDFDKLESLNAHYIKEADNERLLQLCRPFYEDIIDDILPVTAQEMILECMNELKSRAKTLLQIVDESVFFAQKKVIWNDEARAILTQDDAKTVLDTLKHRFETLEDWSSQGVQSLCKEVAKELTDGKLGMVGMPLRAAITGRTASPGIFNVCAILGQEETLKRLA